MESGHGVWLEQRTSLEMRGQVSENNPDNAGVSSVITVFIVKPRL